jgi:hypothetical protein
MRPKPPPKKGAEGRKKHSGFQELAVPLVRPPEAAQAKLGFFSYLFLLFFLVPLLNSWLARPEALLLVRLAHQHWFDFRTGTGSVGTLELV